MTNQHHAQSEPEARQRATDDGDESSFPLGADLAYHLTVRGLGFRSPTAVLKDVLGLSTEHTPMP